MRKKGVVVVALVEVLGNEKEDAILLRFEGMANHIMIQLMVAMH